MDKKRVFSGIQPTGGFTLGNYIGALRNWKTMQDENDCIYCVVDLHALTVRHEPAVLRRQSLESAALILACGVDPEKSLLFVQSHVPAHAELAWLLGCYTGFGELSRMTQFKDKSQKHADNINSGLFTYPVLMAADILLYQTDEVPIGEDQRQHVEIARDIALRFNGLYPDTFKVPEGVIPKVGARIMSLQDPSKKMSKSDEVDIAKVMLLDEPDVIVKKFKRAVTDSGSEVKRGEGKAGVENLMSIYSAVTGKGFDDIEREFEGRGYGDFKAAVGESVCDMLRPVQDEYKRYLSDREELMRILKNGADTADHIARRTLSKAYKKVGLVERPR